MDANNGQWEGVAEPVRSELRVLFGELEAEVGLSKALARRWAKLTAETWATTDAVSQEAAVLAVRRRTGRGRRPTKQVVFAAAKRQALQIDTAAKALATLRDLAGRNGHHPADNLAARILALPVLSPPPAAAAPEADS
jgi:hypothetical protein